MAEKIEFQITVKGNELETALKSGEASAKKTADAVYTITGAFKSASDEASRLKSSFVGNLGANLVSNAFQLLKTGIGDTITNAREFSRALAEVNSILPQTSKLTKEQANNFILLSSQYGKSSQEQAKAYYEIVSAGVEDVSTAFKILRSSNEAAIAGLTDVNLASKVLTSTFNAFASQGVSVTEISDALFQSVKDGQTTFEALAGSLGRVSPIAASVGLSINEVAGTIGFLTKSGLGTEQAITGLRSALSSIIKPSKEATDEAARLGLAFNVNGLQAAGGFAQFLEKVKVASGGSSTSIAKLFGDVNAINAVVSIAGGNFQDFNKILENNKNSLGATSLAAKEVKDSFDFKAGQAEQSIKNLGLSFSVFLLPALKTTLEGFKALTGIANRAVELDENRKKLRDLAQQYNNITDAIEIYKKGLGATAQETLFAIKIIKSQADGEQKLNDILKQRQELRGASTSPEVVAGAVAKPPVDPAIEAEAVRIRNETLAQLTLANDEYALAQQQRLFDANLSFGAASETDLQTLISYEQQKIDAKYAAEIEKTKLIADEQARRNAILAINQKKETEIEAKKITEKGKLAKSQSDEEIRLLSIKNNYIQASATLASALFKEGSKEAFLIQKAAAIAGIYIDDAKARSAAIAAATAIDIATLGVGGPVYLAKQNALITSSTVLSSAAVAASALKGFASGGVVGASMGPDNQLATVRTGEMILNANQQESLFRAINSGSFGGGDIIIKIDEREVARAVRSQVQQGYKIA
jgi:TP901 family phage tail tape measure protein